MDVSLHDWVLLGVGFFSFSLVSSSIYVLNDILDCKSDAQHPKKRLRPVASGAVGVISALCISVILGIVGLALSAYVSIFTSWEVFAVLGIYFLLNLGYCIYLKGVPIIEVAILSSGFLLRVLYGGFVSATEVSSWLYLTVLSFSFYMGLGKRRNEFEKTPARETRIVLKQYSRRFLDRNMYMFLALSVCFYSLWAMEQGRWSLWSVPIVMLGCMRYSLIVEGSSDGDPVEVLTSDKLLLTLGVGYVLYMMAFMYFL